MRGDVVFFAWFVEQWKLGFTHIFVRFSCCLFAENHLLRTISLWSIYVSESIYICHFIPFHFKFIYHFIYLISYCVRKMSCLKKWNDIVKLSLLNQRYRTLISVEEIKKIVEITINLSVKKNWSRLKIG